MIKNCIGLISAFESRDFLKSLTLERAVATVPIAGKYRAIDFQLSNLVNSSISTVGILTDKNSRSLRDHLENGKSWKLTRKHGGLFLFSEDVKSDTEALCNNLELLYRSRDELVVFAPSYMIGNIDLSKAIEYHKNSENDITIIYKKVFEECENFQNCDALVLNEENRVTEVFKNFFTKREINISTEVFILSRTLLLSILEARPSSETSLKEIIYLTKSHLKLGGFEHTGYLSCLNSLSNYFKTNMDMRDIKVLKDLFFNEDRPIYSKVKDSIPTHYSQNCVIKDSLISNECSIKGTVLNSVLSRFVRVEEGAIVENSILLQNCTVKSGVILKNVIIDKDVVLDEHSTLEGHSFYPLVIQKRSRF